MALNMKTLTQALAKTAAVIEKKVQTTVQEVTGPKPLQDYELIDQIGSAGPGLAWKLYSAKARGGSSLSQQYPTVCLWLLDKRALSEARMRAGLSKAAEDSFFDIIRADAAKLVRLRHPGVAHVVQALDETKNAMAMVTEPLFASVANVLGHLENIEKVPKELKGIEMGLLEVKHGLLQIAESLDFLHNNAHLVHRAISPETVLITSNGAWKLGGFGFAVSADQASADMANVSSFHYVEYDVDDDVLPLQPSLNYTAPELVRKSSTAGYYSDIFSFACVAYHLIARKPLFDCHNNVKMYMNNLTYLSRAAFSSIPLELVIDLQKMLSANEMSRPTALDFTGSPFFRDDTRLRALRFLDHMLGRDNMQKSEFLKALADMWKDFDGRVLRYKVLPPLCAELRNMVMQPMILPMVLTIVESQDKNDFALSTMPALVPVLSNAAGETLLLLVKHAELIINKTSPEDLDLHVLPMFVRAFDDTDNRMQEEALKKTVKLAKQLDVQLVEKEILHRVHGLALRTTVAAVRVNALVCLADMVHMLDKHAVLEILHTIRRCTAVDQSAPTLMCTLGVANSILKQFGIEFAAEHVLPLLAPLLIAQQLNVQQFAKYMFFVKDILRKIEEKRGVTVTDSGIPEVRPSLAGTVHQSEPAKKANISILSNISSPAWDEDWKTARGPTTSGQASTTTISSPQPALANVNQPIKVGSSNSLSAMISAASGQQTSASCPAIDIEWPPKSSYAGSIQFGDSDNDMHNPNIVASNANLSDLDHHNPNSVASNANLNDLDPFADWPPHPSGSLNASRRSNNGAIALPVNKYLSGSIGSMQNGLSIQANNSSSWAFDSPSSIDPLRPSQGTPIGSVVNSGLNPQNSLGYLKHNQGISAGSIQKATDLESIFVSGMSEQTAPRLAPPPSSTVGRGRGRGRGRGTNQGQLGAPPASSMYTKSQSEQPPLMDLL